MSVTETGRAVRALRILSVEDDPDTIAGPLATLEEDGHCVARAETSDDAERLLSAHRFDFLILDQRMPHEGRFDGEAGSKLVQGLKQGKYGNENIDIAFVFVVGAEDWVDTNSVAPLQGYRGTLRKAGPVGRSLRGYAEEILKGDDRAGELFDLRRVLARVVEVDTSRQEPRARVVIPSWSPTEIAVLPLRLFLAEDDEDSSSVVGKWFFGWINLAAPDAIFLGARDFEEAEPLDDDDVVL